MRSPSRMSLETRRKELLTGLVKVQSSKSRCEGFDRLGRKQPLSTDPFG
jgi:hypothetical protein